MMRPMKLVNNTSNIHKTELSMPRALASRATHTSSAIFRANITMGIAMKVPQQPQPARLAAGSDEPSYLCASAMDETRENIGSRTTGFNFKTFIGRPRVFTHQTASQIIRQEERLSAFNDVQSQPGKARFLVSRLHVHTCAVHRLDDLVERNLVRARIVHGKATGVDGFDCAHAVAFDAGNLHKPADG